jgi:hypothetical protein
MPRLSPSPIRLSIRTAFRSPLLLGLIYALVSPLAASVTVRKAVFSDRQLFWPALSGKGRPAPSQTKAAHGAHATAGNPGGPGAGVATGGKEVSVRLAVLPIAFKDYSESQPCDSCHRLSANGMEFFLENYLRARMETRFPGQHVELVAPSDPLMDKRVDLMRDLDSLRLPWGKWLADSGENVIYRPKDRYTDAGMRGRLDRLGGMLGATHLLIPMRAFAHVKPISSDTHTGGLAWGFSLVLWNVAAGSPEWALEYNEDEFAMDLDESLEGRLDKALGAVWESLPAELLAQWAAEPR